MNEPRSYAKLHVEGYVGKFVAVYIGDFCVILAYVPLFLLELQNRLF